MPRAYSLDFAKLSHGVHIDPDLACPLCIADELQAKAEARLEELRSRDLSLEPDGGRLVGAWSKAAYARLDLAELLREGEAILETAERGAFGLSLAWRMAPAGGWR